MATFNNNLKTVISDGTNTIVKTNGIEQKFSTNEYTLNSPLTSTTYTQGNLLQMGVSRNVEIIGNSQENYAGRGVTCDYSIKVIGSPEIFTGVAQMGADKELAGIISLILQEGDDRKTAPQKSIQGINPKEIVSNLSSNYQSSIPINYPPIRKLSDIPLAAARVIGWATALNVADMQHQASVAAELTIEQQQRRIQNNIDAMTSKFGEMFDKTTISAAPIASDTKQGDYNITKQVLFDNYYPHQDSLIAFQKNIG